ncbi:MAG: aminoacyl-tRNA hydrolase [Planctomycetota bacterium]
MELQSPARKFVVGLGNPGRRYAQTRHNVGFKVVETFAQRWQLGDARRAFEGEVADGRIGREGREVAAVVLEPRTYMNRSGRSVRSLLQFYKADPRDMLVVYDDLALELGMLRARASGSAGGHNGMADVLRNVDTNEVPRLRVGIGAPPGRMDPKDYVLSKFGSDELEAINVAIVQAADAVEDWLFCGIRHVMDTYNARQPG